MAVVSMPTAQRERLDVVETVFAERASSTPIVYRLNRVTPISAVSWTMHVMGMRTAQAIEPAITMCVCWAHASVTDSMKNPGSS